MTVSANVIPICFHELTLNPVKGYANIVLAGFVPQTVADFRTDTLLVSYEP